MCTERQLTHDFGLAGLHHTLLTPLTPYYGSDSFNIPTGTTINGDRHTLTDWEIGGWFQYKSSQIVELRIFVERPNSALFLSVITTWQFQNCYQCIEWFQCLYIYNMKRDEYITFNKHMIIAPNDAPKPIHVIYYVKSACACLTWDWCQLSAWNKFRRIIQNACKTHLFH